MRERGKEKGRGGEREREGGGSIRKRRRGGGKRERGWEGDDSCKTDKQPCSCSGLKLKSKTPHSSGFF